MEIIERLNKILDMTLAEIFGGRRQNLGSLPIATNADKPVEPRHWSQKSWREMTPTERLAISGHY
jgi:hypothetical protein